MNTKNPRGWTFHSRPRRPAQQNTAARAGNALADLTATLDLVPLYPWVNRAKRRAKFAARAAGLAYGDRV